MFTQSNITRTTRQLACSARSILSRGKASAVSAAARCPPEIWFEIFTFACTDGGNTGRALSLVSRHFKEISGPVQLQSVAIFWVSQMQSFLGQLQRRPPTHRRVRHLLLADSRPRNDLDSRDDSGLEHHWSRRRAAYNLIMLIVAPTLRTLTVTFSCPLDAIVPPGSELSVLKDLTVQGYITETYGLEPTPQIPPLPGLRRLNIYGVYRGPPLLPLIAAAAPGLTWLCISGFGHEPEIVRDLLGIINGGHLNAASQRPYPPGPLLPSLRYVTLMPSVHEVFMSFHDQFRQPSADKQTKVSLMRAPPSPMYRIEHAARDWTDVVSGRDGCWRRYANAENIQSGSTHP